MRITGVESRHFRIELEPPFAAAWDPVPRPYFEETISMVHTDEGFTGYAGGAPVLDLELLGRLLVGIDPMDTGRVWEICQTVDFHWSRPWPIEVAVWDLVGRVEGKPLWELLGGHRNEYQVYASFGERLAPEARVERLLALQAAGFKAAKLRFHASDWHEDLAVVVAARQALGSSMELIVDANQGWRMPGDVTPRWTLRTAMECAEALAELNVYWLEEPLDTAAVEAYRELRTTSSVRIAGGEMVRTVAESLQLATAVDVIQNDVVLAGGITGCRRVAEAALAVGTVWSPHTWTTGLGLLANLHAALAFSDGEFLEFPYDPPFWTAARRDFMLPEPIEVSEAGTVRPPTGDGLGVVPDLDYLERYRVG